MAQKGAIFVANELASLGMHSFRQKALQVIPFYLVVKLEFALCWLMPYVLCLISQFQVMCIVQGAASSTSMVE